MNSLKSMQPITLPANDLKTALAGLAKIIPKKSESTAGIHLSRSAHGRTRLTATDGDSFVSYTGEIQPDNVPFEAVLPFDQLKQFAAQIKGTGTIVSIALTDTHAQVSLPGQPPLRLNLVKEFPIIPTGEAEFTPLDPRLPETIRSAFESTSRDPHRQVLNGVLLEISKKNGTHVVASDGKRLFDANSFRVPTDVSLILPPHKFWSYRPFLEENDWQFRVFDTDKRWIEVKSAHWTLLVKEIDGTFPNWRQVIPTEKPLAIIDMPDETRVKLKVLVESLPDHDATNHGIRLVFNANTVRVHAQPEPNASWKEYGSVPVACGGKEIVVVLNRRFLLQALDCDMPILEFRNPMAPLRFVRRGGHASLIVMPLRADDPPVKPATTAPAPQPPTPAVTKGEPMKQNTRFRPVSPEPPTTVPDDKSPDLFATLERQTEEARGAVKQALRCLTTLSDTLKEAKREHRNKVREIESVRGTLRNLQKVRI